MKTMLMVALGAGLAMPALAQTATTTTPHHARPHARSSAYSGGPVDHGPFTPQANRAYNGGGAILEGEPGGPPPPASAVLTQPRNQPLPPPQ